MNHPIPATAGSRDPYIPEPYVKLTHPDWTRRAVVYQINTRQFTAEVPSRRRRARSRA